MSSSSSQTEGSPNGSPARERSTTRDTSVTLASDGDGQQAEQAPKRTRKSPTKNTSARNGGKKWAIKEVSTYDQWYSSQQTDSVSRTYLFGNSVAFSKTRPKKLSTKTSAGLLAGPLRRAGSNCATCGRCMRRLAWTVRSLGLRRMNERGARRRLRSRRRGRRRGLGPGL
jgi:hypothetical protein